MAWGISRSSSIGMTLRDLICLQKWGVYCVLYDIVFRLDLESRVSLPYIPLLGNGYIENGLAVIAILGPG